MVPTITTEARTAIGVLIHDRRMRIIQVPSFKIYISI